MSRKLQFGFAANILKEKLKAVAAASLCALFAGAAGAAPPSDPIAEAVAQKACQSDRPLVVFDTFYILNPKHGDQYKPDAPEMDFNGDMVAAGGNLDGHHGDLVATVAGFSGKRVIPYQVANIHGDALATSFQTLADDIEKGVLEFPAAIIVSIASPGNINAINRELPPDRRLTMNNLAQNKEYALKIALSYDHDDDGYRHKMEKAFQRIAAHKIPVFVSAGNSGSEPLFNMLALFPGTYAVGSVNPDDSKTAYTSDSSLIALWRNGRFVFKTVPGGIDINNDGKPDFADANLSHGESVATHYNGRSAAQTVQQVPDWVRMMHFDKDRTSEILGKNLPEGIYPVADLLQARGYADTSGMTVQSLKQGPYMHHPSMAIFKVDNQGKLIFDPEGSGDKRQVVVYDGTSFATPNICAPGPK